MGRRRLKHALQYPDLVASFGELLRQTLVRLLQIEDGVLEQHDPIGQLAPAGRRAEDVGDDLVGTAVICHGRSPGGSRPAAPAGTSQERSMVTTTLALGPTTGADWNYIKSFQTW